MSTCAVCKLLIKVIVLERVNAAVTINGFTQPQTKSEHKFLCYSYSRKNCPDILHYILISLWSESVYEPENYVLFLNCICLESRKWLLFPSTLAFVPWTIIL